MLFLNRSSNKCLFIMNLWQNTDCNVMLLWFVKTFRVKTLVLYWFQTRDVVICYLLALLKLKGAQFCEVIERFLIEFCVRRFLLVAAL